MPEITLTYIPGWDNGTITDAPNMVDGDPATTGVFVEDDSEPYFDLVTSEPLTGDELPITLTLTSGQGRAIVKLYVTFTATSETWYFETTMPVVGGSGTYTAAFTLDDFVSKSTGAPAPDANWLTTATDASITTAMVSIEVFFGGTAMGDTSNDLPVTAISLRGDGDLSVYTDMFTGPGNGEPTGGWPAGSYGWARGWVSGGNEALSHPYTGPTDNSWSTGTGYYVDLSADFDPQFTVGGIPLTDAWWVENKGINVSFDPAPGTTEDVWAFVIHATATGNHASFYVTWTDPATGEYRFIDFFNTVTAMTTEEYTEWYSFIPITAEMVASGFECSIFSTVWSGTYETDIGYAALRPFRQFEVSELRFGAAPREPQPPHHGSKMFRFTAAGAPAGGASGVGPAGATDGASAQALAVGSTSAPTPIGSMTADVDGVYFPSWWKVTPEVSQVVEISAMGSAAVDTVLDVFSDEAGTNQIGGNDDEDRTYDSRSVLYGFSMVAGKTYYLRLSTYDSVAPAGDYVLSLTPTEVAFVPAAVNGGSLPALGAMSRNNRGDIYVAAQLNPFDSGQTTGLWLGFREEDGTFTTSPFTWPTDATHQINWMTFLDDDTVLVEVGSQSSPGVMSLLIVHVAPDRTVTTSITAETALIGAFQQTIASASVFDNGDGTYRLSIIGVPVIGANDYASWKHHFVTINVAGASISSFTDVLSPHVFTYPPDYGPNYGGMFLDNGNFFIAHWDQSIPGSRAYLLGPNGATVNTWTGTASKPSAFTDRGGHYDFPMTWGFPVGNTWWNLGTLDTYMTPVLVPFNLANNTAGAPVEFPGIPSAANAYDGAIFDFTRTGPNTFVFLWGFYTPLAGGGVSNYNTMYLIEIDMASGSPQLLHCTKINDDTFIGSIDYTYNAGTNRAQPGQPLYGSPPTGLLHYRRWTDYTPTRTDYFAYPAPPAPAPVEETSFVLGGPTGDMPWAEKHKGAYAIPEPNEVGQRTISMQVQVASPGQQPGDANPSTATASPNWTEDFERGTAGAVVTTENTGFQGITWDSAAEGSATSTRNVIFTTDSHSGDLAITAGTTQHFSLQHPFCDFDPEASQPTVQAAPANGWFWVKLDLATYQYGGDGLAFFVINTGAAGEALRSDSSEYLRLVYGTMFDNSVGLFFHDEHARVSGGPVLGVSDIPAAVQPPDQTWFKVEWSYFENHITLTVSDGEPGGVVYLYVDKDVASGGDVEPYFKYADWYAAAGLVLDDINVVPATESNRSVWVQIFAQWLRWSDTDSSFVEGSIDPVTPAVQFGGDKEWTDIEVYKPVTDDLTTHWKPKFVFYSADPRRGEAPAPLVGGTEVYIECLYVPDNGRSLADREYLDGDQPYGVWEGDRRRSSSIYGKKTAIVLGDAYIIPTPPTT